MRNDLPTALAGPPREAPPPCAPPRPETAEPVFFVAGRIVTCPPKKPAPEQH